MDGNNETTDKKKLSNVNNGPYQLLKKDPLPKLKPRH